MKKLVTVFLIISMAAAFVSGCIGKERQKQAEVTVSAAASLKDVLDEIISVYEKKNPDIKIILNFGSSGTLQQQIEQGAPVDLFISAGKNQMDALERKQLIVNTSRVNLIGNDLVLVTGKDNDSISGFVDLIKPEVKHIGIGQPESVPAGKYARETLTSLKLWDTLKSKYVEAKDVRQVMAYVETGNAEAGLVYRSDTIVSDKVKVAAVAPESSHSSVVYPAAVIKSSKNGAAAGEFLRFMKNPEAIRVFTKYGFKDLSHD